MLVFTVSNLLEQVQVLLLRLGRNRICLNDTVTTLYYSLDILGLFDTETVKRYDLKDRQAGKYSYGLEDEALTSTSTRNKEDIGLPEDNTIYGIDLYLCQLSRRVGSRIKKAQNLFEAELDNAALRTDRFLVYTGIVDKLLDYYQVDVQNILGIVLEVRYTLERLLGDLDVQ